MSEMTVVFYALVDGALIGAGIAALGLIFWDKYQSWKIERRIRRNRNRA